MPIPLRVLLCAVLTALPCGAAAQAARDSAADARLREVVRAVNAGRADGLRATLHPDLALERQTAAFGAMHDRSRGFEVREVVAVAPGEAAARLRSRLTGWDEWLAVQVEPSPPFRVTRVGAPSRALPASRPAPRAATDAERARELGRFVDRLAAADAFSGVVLLARGDSVLFARGYGWADRARRVRNGTGTRFRWESLTKPLTAVAIAQLAERGRLSLDDTLGRFFPDFPLREARGAVRIKHLLSHTSGLADYLTVRASAPPRTLDEFVRLVERAQADTLLAAPGTRWAYNNAGFVLLGRIVEMASGMEYRAYLREHVLAPAGMRGAGVQEPRERPARLADGYDKVFNGAGVEHRAVPSGGPEAQVGVADNGVYGTAEDVLRFTRAFLGGRLVSPGMVRTMTTPRPELGAPRWGYGFEVDAARGMVSHGGTWRGASNSVDHWRGGGYTAVVLSNYTAGRTLPREMLRLLVPER
jgi:CubicO group peptidase (beta-lactamase class C family)